MICITNQISTKAIEACRTQRMYVENISILDFFYVDFSQLTGIERF